MTQGNCPACGATIVFKLGSSIVVVCEHCRSAVARTDRALEDLGKVAALAATPSPLRIGLSGRIKDVPFEIVGRAQIKHSAGGLWDEWYAAFANGQWGWLAEAQGKFYLTFQKKLPGTPDREKFSAGKPAPPELPADLVVAEVGTGTYVAAEGEIPFRLSPNEEYTYADLSGDNGRFATVDFSEDRPLYYEGRELPLSALGVELGAQEDLTRAKRTGTAQVSCPKCGGVLELRAPDQAERVGCGYCGALLDCTQGNLKYLETLKPGKYRPVLALGSSAVFENVTQTVIGFLVRSVKIEGIRYFWTEYLLYNPTLGFRWLVHSDAHWTYVRPLPAAAVRRAGANVIYEGQTFKRFQDAPAEVEYVLGEFYWKVAVGEMVQASDYVNPPCMISREITRDEQNAEVNCSLSVYVPVDEIKTKFKLPALPRPSTVGACQPFPYRNIYRSWGIFSLIAVGLIVVVHLTSPERVILNRSFQFPATAATPEAGAMLFTDPFELQGGKNIQVQASAPVDNSWVFVEGDFVNDTSGEVQPFGLELAHYHGVEDGEAWSEGSKGDEVYLSALPAGRYVLRLGLTKNDPRTPSTVQVVVKQGVARWLNDLLLLLGLSLLPIIVALLHWSFETRRWAESMYGGGNE